MEGAKRILGIDPGTHRLGYGVIDVKGPSMTSVAYGCIEPTDTTNSGRLNTIYTELNSIISRFSPEEVAIEELYFAKNVTTGLKVAEARGVILLAAYQAGLITVEYKPNIIKSAVTGYGHADKKQMQTMVRMQLKLQDIPRPDDAADGLAVAICHSLYRKFNK